MMSNTAAMDILLPGVHPDMLSRLECLCTARAQVMSRDEGTRLWRPLDGGGMSVVQLSCAPAESDDVTGDAKMSYCIIGCKENDLVLFCMISDDLTYTRATPTFHHWQTGSCSYGLTFQSPSEADTFAKAVDHSVEVMGHDCTDEEVFLTCHEEADTCDSSCGAKMLTVVAEIENPVPVPVAETASDANLSSCTVSTEKSGPAAVEEEKPDISLSELEQVLPKLPPKQSQVPPRSVLSRSKPASPQSVTAAPPRPPAVSPKQVRRTHSAASSGLPPVPPRVPRTTATVIHNYQSTLSSLQQSATTSTSNVGVPHPASLSTQASPDTAALGPTFNYVYFTEDAVLPAKKCPVTKNRKLKTPPDVASRYVDIGKKLADSGFGTVIKPSSDSYDSNSAGSYVRLAVPSSPRPAVDPATSHEYCYPSIDAVVPAPTISICRIEPQHSPPPLPTKSRRVGWWDCYWRRQRTRSSQLRATWSQRSSAYGTELSVAASHVSLNNSQSSSLNTRRPPAKWRSRLLCFVRTCIHPTRWRRHRWQMRRLGSGRSHHEFAVGRL